MSGFNALKELNKLSKDLKSFQDLLKAKVLTSLESETPSKQQEAPVDPASLRQPQSPSVQGGIDTAIEEKEGPSKVSVRPMASDVSDLVSLHGDDEQIKNMHKLHGMVSDRLANRHPKHTVRDLDQIENAIRMRAKELKPSEQFYSEKPRDISQIKAEKEQRLKTGALPTDKREIALGGVAAQRKQGERSSAKEKAERAERKVVGGYTGQYEPESYGQGFSFIMPKEKQPEGYIDKTTPSRTIHSVMLNGRRIGLAQVDHSARKSGGRPSSYMQFQLDKSHPEYQKLSRDMQGTETRAIEGALESHLKSKDFRDQLSMFPNPAKEIEAESAKGRASTGRVEQPTAKEVQQIRQEMQQEGEKPRTRKDEKYSGYAPEAPISGFDREKAITEKVTAPEGKAPKEERKKELSLETKRLREQLMQQHKEKAKESEAREPRVGQSPYSPPSYPKIGSKSAEPEEWAYPGKYTQTKEETPKAQESLATQSSSMDDVKSAIHHPNEFIRNAVISQILSGDDPDHLEELMRHPDSDVRGKAQKRMADLFRALKSKSA